MSQEGVEADVVTFSCILNVCAKATEAGRATIHDADVIMGLMRLRKLLVIDTVLCNTFLECARADGSEAALELAEAMLSQMREQDCDSYTYSAMMVLYGKTLGVRGGQRAIDLLRTALMGEKESKTYLYNAAMSANLPHTPRAVLELQSQMFLAGIDEDQRTMLCVREAEDLLQHTGLQSVQCDELS